MRLPRRTLVVFIGVALGLFLTQSAQAVVLANRVFVSQRSGDDSNGCNNILTPCLTFAGAIAQLNPGGEAIVLDSGGYGPITITQSLTIEAPPGVLAFIHPASGDAITVNAGPADIVTLRGLTLNGGMGNGITGLSFATLNVENCFISGFANDGIHISGSVFPGELHVNMKGTDITDCGNGVLVAPIVNDLFASVDHCHFDGNGNGYFMATPNFAISRTIATNSTANNNAGDGWICGGGTAGFDFLRLEFCAGAANGVVGLYANSTNAAVHISNCIFANNFTMDVQKANGSIYSRGNNSAGPVIGTITPDASL